MRWLLTFAIVWGGLGQDNVLLVNHTGLGLARVEIDKRRFETIHSNEEQILVSVTPEKHDLKLVFLGGADVDWPHFDFKGVHEIIFERKKNKIEAHAE